MFKLRLETPQGSELSEVTLFTFNPYFSIVYGQDSGQVVPCFRNTCYTPIDDPGQLRNILENAENFPGNRYDL